MQLCVEGVWKDTYSALMPRSQAMSPVRRSCVMSAMEHYIRIIMAPPALQAKHYRSYLYHDVPSGYLDWAHRRSAIVAELAHLQPDIICLQEVDRYDDLEEELQQLG